jgi:hypothetical protein
MAGKENSPSKPKPAKISRLGKKDEEGFITPTPPSSPRKTRKGIRLQKQADFISENQFEPLSEQIAMDENDDVQSQVSTTMSSPERRRKQTTKVVTNQQKPAKPIVVTNTTFETLKNTIAVLTLSQHPTIQKRRGNDFTIIAKNSNDKKTIVEKLKSDMHQHFTFTENQDRHLMFVLLGHHETSVEKVKEELVTAKIPAKKVSKINNSIVDPIFLVSFEKNTMTLADLQYQHYELNGLRIRWDKHKPRNRRPTQCRRCQRFGHAANNCALPYRCVKCLETHNPGECARTSREIGQPSCVNCKVEGHTSNSASCPAYKKHIDAINARKKPLKQHQPREFTSAPFDWNQHNFPSIASQSSPSTSQPPIVNRTNREYRPPLNNSVDQNLPDKLGALSQIRGIFTDFSAISDIKETMQLFANLVEELKTTSSHEERIFILLSYTGFMPQSSSTQK